ncbi:MAG TPA: hypothetical protein VFL55_18730 [Acetobacteraceae bacterium]|nr:hypothetical protein [Acetobacteraceae bacterium]
MAHRDWPARRIEDTGAESGVAQLFDEPLGARTLFRCPVGGSRAQAA